MQVVGDVIYGIDRFRVRVESESDSKSGKVLAPLSLLPSLEEPRYSDPRKRNTSNAFEHARLKSAYLCPLRCQHTQQIKIDDGSQRSQLTVSATKSASTVQMPSS